MIRTTKAIGISFLAFAAFAILAPVAAADGTAPPVSAVAPKTCGEGVCKRTVTGPVCTPGSPVSENGGWLAAIDPSTQSWDANCNGTVEKEVVDVESNHIGCALLRGTACVGQRAGTMECGHKESIWAKCELATRADGSKYCHTGALHGSFVQRCR